MEPECLILIAYLCLPLEPQTLEVTTSMLGAQAQAQIGKARVSVEFWTDALDHGARNPRKCQEDACTHFRVRQAVYGDGSDGAWRRDYEFDFSGKGPNRRVTVQAPDEATLTRTVETLRLKVPKPGGGHVWMPLSGFEVRSR